MNKLVMGLSIFVGGKCHTVMLLNDIDISRLMVYAKQIKESKLREIMQEGKWPRSDESIHLKPKKMLFHHENSMGNKYMDPNLPSEGSGNTFDWTRCFSCMKSTFG